MSDNPVETTATEAQPSNPVPATTPAPSVDVEAIRKAARLETLREAQSKHDQQLARTHKEYQAQLREVKAAAAAKLGKVGYDDPDAIFRDVEVLQKARQYDELSAQAQQQAEWDNYVAGIAGAYDLSPSDPRLADATSAADLQAKVKAAFAADAEKRKEAAAKEARAAAVAKAEAKVENGDLDTLGGAPAAGAPGQDALSKAYRAEVAPLRGNIQAIMALKKKYRAKGLTV